MAAKHVIVKLFALLTAAGCRPPASVDAVDMLPVWQMLLSDVDDDAMIAAAGVYLRRADSTWWPTPGALIALIPGRAPIDDADEAYGALNALAKNATGHMPPEVLSEDPRRAAGLAAALAALGGWTDFRRSTEPEQTQRAAFRAAYRSAIAKLGTAQEWEDSAKLLGVAPRQIGGPS
jgi:hypothetical protein